jgi:hypothetical protein
MISNRVLLYRKVRFGAKNQASAFVRLRPWTARDRAGRLKAGRQNLLGRLDMSRSRLALAATMMLLSIGFVLCPQDSAYAAKFCAQLRGSTAAGQPDCSFSTLEACRARVRHLGGGHCYKLTH